MNSVDANRLASALVCEILSRLATRRASRRRLSILDLLA